MEAKLALSLMTVFVLSASATAKETRPSTPDQVLAEMKAGNMRYLTAISKHERFDVEKRVATALHGQKPIVTVLGCADSRVPPEIVFDQGFADVFVVRIAGNVCGDTETASVEYGVEYLGTPLVVVLGHTRCGAIEAALSGKQLPGHLPKLLTKIQPAVESARRYHPKFTGDALLNAAIEENVWYQMETLIRSSDIVRKRVKDGRLKVVGALRDLMTGKVTWLGEHPKQKELLTSL